MVKDISARYRAGNFPPPGQAVTTLSNAETDALSKALLAQVSAGPALMNYTHICTRIWFNMMNIEYALEYEPMLRNMQYGAAGTVCGNQNVMPLADSQELGVMNTFVPYTGNADAIFLRVPSDNVAETLSLIGLLTSAIPPFEVNVVNPNEAQPFVACDYRLGPLSAFVIVKNTNAAVPVQPYQTWIQQQPVFTLPTKQAVYRTLSLLFSQIPDPEAVRAGLYLALSAMVRMPTDGQSAAFDTNHPPVVGWGGVIDALAPQSGTVTMLGQLFYDTKVYCDETLRAAEVFMGFFTTFEDIALFRLDIVSMTVISRSLVLRAYGTGFCSLAQTAAINDTFSTIPASDPRARTSELTTLDSSMISDYGASLTKCLHDVFGILLPKSVQVIVSKMELGCLE